jgi:integrase
VRSHVPKYRRHSGRDKAFIEIRRRRIYLPGRFGSPESRQAYVQQLAALRAEDEGPPPPTVTVASLARRYLDWAVGYYDNAERDCLRGAIQCLVDEAAGVLVREFGPRAFRLVRDAMVARGWSRGYVNHQAARLRRVFRWGVARELVPPAVLQGLQAVAPLRAGRTAARETPPVLPVDPGAVEATAAVATPVVAAMIRVQAATGMRSGNLVRLRPGDLDRSGEVWLYRPASHKSAWRGQDLVIPLGPRAQAALKPFLDRPPEVWCFSPRESEAARRHSRIDQRKPRARRPGLRYTTRSYRRAVARACARAGIEPWTPHRLRHTVATAIRAEFGLEAAQTVLGHSRADVTQMYATRDLALAISVAARVG